MPVWIYPTLRIRDLPATRLVMSQKDRSPERMIRVPSRSWAAVDGTVFVAPLDEKAWCNPANFRIWPANQESGLWYLENGHTSITNACELRVQGVVRRVQVLAKSVDEKPRNIRKYFPEAIPPLIPHMGRLRLLPFGTAGTITYEDDSSSGHANVIGFGWFDIAEEKRDSLSCVWLVCEHGLMLEEVCPGRFRRLGGFVVTTDGQR